MSNLKFGGQVASLEGTAYLAGHGFDFADLNLNEMDKISREEGKIIKTARRGDLFFVAHAPDLRVDDEEGLARIREAIEYSAVFKPRTITIHPILAPSANTLEKLETKVREITVLADLAAGFGSRIACENTSEIPEDMKVVLNACPSVLLTLDVGHSELLSEKNKSLDFIDTWPERIGHVHIHDNVGGNTHHEDLHLPLGEGRIDFAPIMTALKRLPQEITITFEMPRQKASEGLFWLRQRNLT